MTTMSIPETLTAATWPRCSGDGSYMIPMNRLLGYAPDGQTVEAIFEYFRHEDGEQQTIRVWVHALNADIARQIPSWDDPDRTAWLNENIGAGVVVDLQQYVLEATDLYWVVDCRPGHWCAYIVSYGDTAEGVHLLPGHSYADIDRYQQADGRPVRTRVPMRISHDTIRRVIADGTASSFTDSRATLVQPTVHMKNRTMGVTDLGAYYRDSEMTCTCGDEAG